MTSASRAAVILLAFAACSTPDPRIPARDGPLVIDVRYPTVGTRVPAVESVAVWGTLGTGRAKLMVNTAEVTVEANGTFAAFLPVPPGPSPSLRFVARRSRDSVVHSIALDRGTRPSTPTTGAAARDDGPQAWNRWVTMQRLPSDTADSATQWRPIYARFRPGGEVALGIAQGIRLFSDARTAQAMRLVLAADQRVWIPRVDADTLTRPRARILRAGAPTVTNITSSDEMLIAVPLPERLPSVVELSGDRLLWTIFGAQWGRRPAAVDGDGSTIRRIVPSDSAAGQVVIDLGLASLPLGWRVEWHAGALQLRVRRRASPSKSLAGLIVAIDPGHPPDGTTGPSRLMEDSVTLAVSAVAAAQLRALGATVLLTRTNGHPLSLEARAVVAEQSPAHVFVSLHLNAPGPGRPPSAVYGTQTFWMNANGRALAQLLLVEVAKAMGQPAIGMYQGEFAVLRPAWAAAVLVEGTGIVVPEREAFLRTPEGVEAYARGVVRGIERWHRMSSTRAIPARPDR